MFKKLVFLPIVIVLLAALGLGIFPSQASAFTPSFNPSNLIDDSVFTDDNSMNASQIQAFLVSLNSNLASYYVTEECGSSSGPNYSFYAAHYSCGKSVLASQLISDSAHAYDISPRTILATMEKEQSLVTTPPGQATSLQINCAMGYLSCDSSVLGFFNQVDNGAWQFHADIELMDGNSYWGYSPSSYPCASAKPEYSTGIYPGKTVTFTNSGGTTKRTITIANSATAALHCYTPYVGPKYNTGSYTGTGYSGSYNFDYYFELWWGTVRGTPFFQVSGDGRIYMQGANNIYYYVTSPAKMADYGYGSKFTYVSQFPSSYLSGQTNGGSLSDVAQFGGDSIYLVNRSVVHHFPNTTIYNAYGYNSVQPSQLPTWMLDYLPQSSDMQTVLSQSDQPQIYFVQNGKKSHIINSVAYNTLGSPVYSSQSSVTLDSAFAASLPDGAPIMPAGTPTETSDTHTYGIWDGSSLQPINSTTAESLGLAAGVYTAPSVVLNQLPQGSIALTSLAQSSNGALYILAAGHKWTISASQLTNLGLSNSNFVSTSDAFLGNIPTAALGVPLIKINNADPIYLVQSGELEHIYSLVDLKGLGYANDPVLNVDNGTGQLFTNQGKQLLAQGRLVSVSGQPQMYVINGNFQNLYIPNTSILKQFGYEYQPVTSISSSTLSQYVNAGNLQQVVKDTDGTLWLIDSATRHQISSAMAGSSYYAINTSNLPQLTATALNTVPQGVQLYNFIQADGDYKVYLVQNGQKRWLTTGQVFASNGGNWKEVSHLSADYVASLPTGAPIT